MKYLKSKCRSGKHIISISYYDDTGRQEAKKRMDREVNDCPYCYPIEDRINDYEELKTKYNKLHAQLKEAWEEYENRSYALFGTLCAIVIFPIIIYYLILDLFMKEDVGRYLIKHILQMENVSELREVKPRKVVEIEREMHAIAEKISNL